MNIALNNITDIEFDGIVGWDAPDFSDAFIASAWNIAEGRPCTEAELDYIQDHYSNEVYEILTERLD